MTRNKLSAPAIAAATLIATALIGAVDAWAGSRGGGDGHGGYSPKGPSGIVNTIHPIVYRPVHGTGSSHHPIVYRPVHGDGSSHNPIID
jgi:hypothetical protein